MSRFAKWSVGRLAVLALVLGACASEPPPPELTHYLQAQEALAADDFNAARAALEQLHAHGPAAVQEVAGRAAAADIGALRLAFRQVSEIVTRQQVPDGYALAYCPMVMDAKGENEVGGYWLQKQGKIMNPYFGAAMLHCGVFKEGRVGSND